MTTTKSTKEIPPLSELVEAPFREVRDFLPHLSLPEILIVGSRPLSVDVRPEHEIAAFGEVVREKLRVLEKGRGAALHEIMASLYPKNGMQRHRILSYLEKYEFLTNGAIPRELEAETLAALTPDVKQDLSHYRSLLHNRNGKHWPHELDRLREAPTDLTFHGHPRYSGREPHLVLAKTKVPQRIAGKIPYDMIEEYRDQAKKGLKGRYKGRLKEVVEGANFKRYLRLEDGVTRDNAGLQFVTLSEDELAKIKGSIFTSLNIEVLAVEEYNDPKFPYRALHIDIAWNPNPAVHLFFNPHVDVIEVQLMQFPYFVKHNFGHNSYWRRANAQERGIVRKTVNNGQLNIERFTQAENTWRVTVRERILHIFNYANPQSRHSYH